MEFYNDDLKNIYSNLNSSDSGLSDSQSKTRLKKYGYNKLIKKKDYKTLKLLIGEFKSPLVLLLFAAGAISYYLNELVDAYVIFLVVIVNALLGFFQEYRAEKAIESLKKLSSTKAKVLRNSKEFQIDASELVPGDIIIIEEGDRIPADARIIQSANLSCDESALTGESSSVDKVSNKILSKNVAVADQKNMVFMNTIVSRGRATAIVVNTGMDTEIGKIAKSIQDQDAPITPLQKKLNIVAKNLGIAAIAISGAVFFIGLFKGETLIEMFTTSVSLAVAAVPEGLPAVVTITLAIGLTKLVKVKSIVRRLPVVETLGSANIICSDKTGTLTKNEMTVKKIYTNHSHIEVSGSGYNPEGNFNYKDTTSTKIKKNLDMILKIGLFCNTARLVKNKSWQIFGDPTEGALIVSANKNGLIKSKLKEYSFVNELPFDSNRKMMSSIYNSGKNNIAFIKGAPEILLEKSNFIFIDGVVKPIKKADKNKIKDVIESYSNDALRVLAFGYKYVGSKKLTTNYVENDIVFVGLQAMMDPPRPEVKPALVKCENAGIRTIMITGDHENTARAIAKELGFKNSDLSITGAELDKLSDSELSKKLIDCNIFARVSPEHKLRIVTSLNKKDNVVAMTGDGVNDAPALKAADIGIAMGIKGTDVAKDSSDMILMDDNFSSIVNAVEEGRGIFDNIRNFIRYLISSNIGEIFTIFAALIVGLPLPLIAVQILWMNLLTDGLPALALGTDPPQKDIMTRKPIKSNVGAISKSTWTFSVFIGIIMMIGTLSLFLAYLGEGLDYARSIAFSTIVFYQLFNIFNSRTDKSVFHEPELFFNNKYLVSAIIASASLQYFVVSMPFIQTYFSTVNIAPLDWFIVILTASSVLIITEIVKNNFKNIINLSQN